MARRTLPILLLSVCLLLGGAVSALAADSFDLDIPAQPLSAALLELARTAGISIGFAAALTDERESIPLAGSFTVDEALQLLLSDASLTYTRYANGVYRVSARSSATAQADHAPPEDAVLPASGQAGLRAADLSGEPVIDEVTTVATRLPNSGFDELAPIKVVGGAFIDVAGVYSMGELFDFVPAAGANTFNGIDNYFFGVNDARGDVSTANLRGLGSGNSLLLLNGRRIVNHPGTQAENQVLATTVNVNSLPLFAIERVEVLLDGASSVHGTDAVAGVINTVVASGRDRTRLGLQHGFAEGTSMNRSSANFELSRSFNERGSWSVFAELSRDEGLPAVDRRFSASSDLRGLFARSDFADDRDLDNRSTSGAWGQFKLPQAVRANGELLTSDTGLFHIQPGTLSGCTADLSPDLCIDSGVADGALRFDSNTYRFLLPEIDRINLFSMWRYEISDALEFYGEAGWYEASSKHTRESSNPLSSHPITIPAGNYWNPFGPLTFADGTPNPNRLPGIDAPPEGLPITINTRGMGGFYRVVDAGPRTIDVDNHSDRLLAGLRTWRGNWSADAALLYSTASTNDLTRGRISSSAFQGALALSTPNAYNPFNGGDPQRLTYGDTSANSPDIIEAFMIDVGRRNTTSLALADLVLTNLEAFRLFGRSAGLSVGAEWRREQFRETRDPRLNGEIGYTDLVTGERYASDVMQSSITPDSSGTRDVTSLFGEISLPLISEEQNIPFTKTLDANLAARFESYSDIGDEWRPRLGLAWRLNDRWGVHASWSSGLRAPSLPQVNAAPVPRIRVTRDWYRCQALINKGLVGTLGACEIEAVRAVEVTTSGSAALKAETNESLSLGLRYSLPSFSGLRTAIDFWQIEQSDVVGLFGVQNHVALDYLLRLNGDSNGAVTREALRPEDVLLFAGSGLQPAGLLENVDERYLNLEGRTTRGIDVSLSLLTETTRFGAFRFELEASRLLKARQSVPEAGRSIVALNEPALTFIGAGNLLERNGRPKWRGSFRLAFDNGSRDFGLFGTYVGRVADTSALQDESNTFLPVDDWVKLNAYAGTRFSLFAGKEAQLRLTVGNLLNRRPPLADESLGYFVGLHDATGRTWNLSLTAEL